mgnify:CR=1 FL=1
MSEETIGYTQALEELKAILVELEDTTVDVDLLADRVARADELLILCRNRLEAAEIQVQRIIVEKDNN